MYLPRQAEPAPNCCRSRLTHSSPRWSRLDCCGAFLGKGKYELTAQSRDGRGAAPAFLGSHPVSPEDAAANGESKEPEVPWRVWAAPSRLSLQPNCCRSKLTHSSPRWSRLDCCGAFLGKGKYELTAQSRDGRGAAPAFLGSHPVSPEDAAANGESKEPEVPWRVWAAPSVTPARPTQKQEAN